MVSVGSFVPVPVTLPVKFTFPSVLREYMLGGNILVSVTNEYEIHLGGQLHLALMHTEE